MPPATQLVTVPRAPAPTPTVPHAPFVRPDGRGYVDLPTVAGIAVLVYVASVVLHEAAGHGLACLAVGAPPKIWGAYYFDCDFVGLPPSAERIVAAAGSTMNLGVALLCMAAWPLARDRAPATRLFLWLAFTVNAFEWAGYFLYSGVTGAGDWGVNGVLTGVIHAPHARVVMVALGAFFYYWWTASRAARMLGAILGGTSAARRTGQRTSATAYASGAVTALIVGLFVPIGSSMVLASAIASSVGGTLGLLFVALGMPRDSRAAGPSLTRSWAWIVAGIAAVVAYAVVLGPGITFAE